jgi:hypothetical protein
MGSKDKYTTLKVTVEILGEHKLRELQIKRLESTLKRPKCILINNTHFSKTEIYYTSQVV